MRENKKPEFSALIEQIRCGSAEAVGLLMEHYEDAIHRVIRRRLNPRLRSQYDTVDFAQIVWASFFTDLDKMSKCKSASELEGLLTTMARNKVIDACRRRLMRERNKADRECRIDRDDSLTPFAIQSSDATPSHIVSIREQWEQLLENLPERHRRMIVLRASGWTIKEIAAQVEMNERTIRRVFTSIQSSVPAIRDDEAENTARKA